MGTKNQVERALGKPVAKQAEESKIEYNFPNETALRTSPANPTPVLPARIPKLLSLAVSDPGKYP